MATSKPSQKMPGVSLDGVGPVDNPYIYRPLSAPRELRLLILHPAEKCNADHVCCTIEHAILDEESSIFEAISYAWGDQSDTQLIYCGGQAIRVTSNLTTALRSLRVPDKPRRLWADAVCINQQDVQERSAQVAMIRDIFSRARRVLIWLGEETAELDGLAATIRAGLALIPDGTTMAEWSDNFSSKWNAHFRDLLRRGEHNFYTHDWTPLFHLLRRPWFRRKWVVQEVACSRDAVAMCGESSHPFRHLGTLATYLAFPGMEATLAAEAERVDPFLFQALANCSLISVLTEPWATGPEVFGGYLPFIRATRNFACSDPRDHVYSILGLLPEGSEQQVSPDYSKTKIEVFTDFATRQLRSGKWELLGLSCTDSRDPALPSWVPDLSCPDQTNLLSVFPSTQREGHRAFSAGGPVSGPVTIINGRILQCRGIIIDAIIDLETGGPNELPSVSSPAASNSQSPPLLLKTRNHHLEVPSTCHWLKRCCAMAAGSQQALSPTRFEQFWRTMTCELHRDRVRMGPETSSLFADYMTYVDECHRIGDSRWHRDMSVRALPIESSLKTFATNGMSFSTTHEGRLGQMPRRARVGDLICVILGARVPIVVRPTGKGTYSLVGECYLNGMMDGEALYGREDEEIRLV